jgi:hypothetical protein
MDAAASTITAAAGVIYLTTPAARGVVDRAAAMLPGPLGARLSVRDLPPGAVL